LFPELTAGNKPINYISLLRGIFSFVFGILLLTHLQGTIEILILSLGAWWMLKGLFGIISIFVGNTRWAWKLLGRIVSVLAGFLVLSINWSSGRNYCSLFVTILISLGLLYRVVTLIAAFQDAGSVWIPSQ